MKIHVVVAFLMLALTSVAQQQEAQTPEQQHAAMMHRGNEGMGFSQGKTTHHFILQKHGGEIQITVKDANNSADLEHIRTHLSHVAKMFSAGDFDIPMLVHDTMPPGVPTMRREDHDCDHEPRGIRRYSQIYPLPDYRAPKGRLNEGRAMSAEKGNPSSTVLPLPALCSR